MNEIRCEQIKYKLEADLYTPIDIFKVIEYIKEHLATGFIELKNIKINKEPLKTENGISMEEEVKIPNTADNIPQTD